MAHVSVAERRPQLIAAAIDLMKRKGATAGSTRAVAAELGVAQATVHYVFGSKEELYRAVIKQLTDNVVSYVSGVEIPASPDFGKSLSFLVQRLWQSLLDEPDTHLLLTELSVIALRMPQLRNVLEEHRRTVDEVTGSLIEATAEHAGADLAASPILLAQFFLAGFDGLTQQHLAAPDKKSEQWRLDSLVSATTALALGRLVPNAAELEGEPS